MQQKQRNARVRRAVAAGRKSAPAPAPLTAREEDPTGLWPPMRVAMVTGKPIDVIRAAEDEP